MAIEFYDDMEWEIEDFPIEFSTPDDWFQNTFTATATCENGHIIEGRANYCSNLDDMSDAWLDSIDYELCEECACMEDECDEEGKEW